MHRLSETSSFRIRKASSFENTLTLLSNASSKVCRCQSFLSLNIFSVGVLIASDGVNQTIMPRSNLFCSAVDIISSTAWQPTRVLPPPVGILMHKKGVSSNEVEL